MSSTLAEPNGHTVVGLGIGAVPKSMGRVEDSEVLGTTYELPVPLGTPKRGFVWLLLDMVKRLFGGVPAIFELVVVALGTPNGPGPANMLLEALEVVTGLKSPDVVVLGTPKGLGPANSLLEAPEVVMAAVVVWGMPTVLNGAAVLLLASIALFEVVVAVLEVLVPADFGPPGRASENLGHAALVSSTGL